MNQQTMILDINKYPAVIEPLYLRQGDKNGTKLVVTILENGEPFYVGSYGVRLCLSIRDIYYEVEGVANENIAEFLIDESYLQYHGYSLNNYVSVYDGDTVICSTNSFKMVVYADSSSEAEPAEIFTNGVQEFLEESEQQVNEAVDRANQAAEAAEGIVLQDVPLMTENIRGGAQLGGSTQTKSGKLEIKLTDSATGETVTCPSASYLARMEKNGMATQNGTPTPDNPIPIQVVEGINLLDESAYVSLSAVTFTGGRFVDSGLNRGNLVGAIARTKNGSTTVSTYSATPTAGSRVAVTVPFDSTWDKIEIGFRTSSANRSATFDKPNVADGTYCVSFMCDQLPSSSADGIFSDIQLEVGSIPQPFVPYGALGLWVRSGGKNLLNVDNGVYKTGAQSNATPRELNGVGTWVGLASNNYLVPSYTADYAVNGNSFTYTSQSNGGYGVGYECKADAGKEYTLSSICTVGATMSASFYNASGAYLSRQQKTATSATDRTTLTFTTPANTAYIVCVFWITGVGVSASFADMMLNDGNEAQPFVPYTSSLTPIPLDGNVLASLPDGTHDVLNIDSAGHVTLTKSTGVIDLGSLNWTDASSPSTHVFRSNLYGQISSGDYPLIPSGNVLPNAIMQKYQRDTWSHISASSDGYFAMGIVSAANQRIAIVDHDYSDSSLFAASVSGEPLYYQLATPTTVDLGYIDIPELEDDCTIEVVSSLASSMTATWWTNEAAPIPEAINAIKDLIGGDTQENTREVLQVSNLRESLRVEDTDEQPEGIETEGE